MRRLLYHHAFKTVTPLVVVFLLSCALFTYRVSGSYNYDSDFGRDVTEMTDITKGNFTFLGPKSSFGGIYTGPAYYYIFAPALRASNYNIASVLIANSLFFAMAVTYFFHTLRKKFGTVKAITSAASLALLPVMLFAARNPGNAYSYVPLSIVVFTEIILRQEFSNRRIFLIGLMGGLLITTHFSNVIFVFLLTVFLILSGGLNKDLFLYFITGAVLPFAPLVLFELKNNFVMIKNTFVAGSWNTFVSKPSAQSGNIIMFINNEIKSLATLPAAAYLTAAALCAGFGKMKKPALLFFLAILYFLLMILLFSRVQYAQFYIIPAVLFMFLSVVFMVLETRYWYAVALLIFFQTLFFPRNLYSPSHRHADLFDRAVRYVIDNKMVSHSESFNTLQIRQNVQNTPYGFEYRFFFKKYGYEPERIDAYSRSKKLIIFSEVKKPDFNALSGWEIEQFGKKNIRNAVEHPFSGVALYSVISESPSDGK